MNLPKNGRIVIIDDSPEDAIPLIECLSANGHPSSYFSGETISELPEDLDGVRLVFLDMELGTAGADTKSKASKTVKVLEKIIHKNNGPVIVVAWTNYDEIYKKFCEYSARLSFPVLPLMIDKDSCKDENGFSITLIWTSITQKLQNIESLNVFIAWENILHKSSQSVVSSFSRFEEIKPNWNSGLAFILLKLARGNLSHRLDRNNPNEVIKSALYSLNGTFFDDAQKGIYGTDYSSLFNISFEGVNENVKTPSIDGRINSKLILTKSLMDDNNMPGNVYDDLDVPKADVKQLYDGNIDQSPKKAEWDNHSKNIFLETTPLCDFVQKKVSVSRILPGFIWPTELENKIKKDFTYISPVVEYNGHLSHLVFDFRLFTSVEHDALKDKKPLFMVQHELLNDIQSELSSHVSRLGILSVGQFKEKQESLS